MDWYEQPMCAMRSYVFQALLTTTSFKKPRCLSSPTAPVRAGRTTAVMSTNSWCVPDMRKVESTHARSVDGRLHRINWSPPGQSGRHFADDILKCIFMNEKLYILIQISLKFAPGGPIDNTTALVQVMAWCRTGNKPLPESLLTRFTDAYMQHYGQMS